MTAVPSRFDSINIKASPQLIFQTAPAATIPISLNRPRYLSLALLADSKKRRRRTSPECLRIASLYIIRRSKCISNIPVAVESSLGGVTLFRMGRSILATYSGGAFTLVFVPERRAILGKMYSADEEGSGAFDGDGFLLISVLAHLQWMPTLRQRFGNWCADRAVG
jgi:hypothetical protein